MANLILTGDTSGTITLSAPLVAGSNTATLPASTGTVALTSDVIGVGQTWQVVTGSRVSGTTYTNSTGKPILIMVRINQSASNSVVVGGVTIITANSSTATFVTYSFIVPNSTTYVVTATINEWSELR
jgi:hypothetical protein